MPYIIAGDPRFFDRGAGSGVAGAGRRIGELSSELARARAHREREKREAEAENRRLDIAELNAKKGILSEANRAADRQRREDERGAAMEGATGEYDAARQRQGGQAFAGGFKGALESSGGALGPFGAMNPRALAKGAEEMHASSQRMQGKKALAARMSPETAKSFLQRAAKEESVEIQSRGYAREAEALEDAVAEGRISEQDGKMLVKELQSAIKSGSPPGGIEQRIAKAYDLQAKLRTRLEDWAEADKQAAGMIDGLRQMIAQVGDGVDPATGVSMKQTLTERLAKAKIEWNRTKEGPSGRNAFREKTDPQGSLAGLQAILFQAQAETDPQGFVEEDAEEAAAQRSPAPTAAQEDAMGIGGGPRLFGKARQRPQEGAGAKQPAEGVAAQPEQAKPKRGLGAKRTDREVVRAMVHDGARDALRAGSEKSRAAAIGKLRTQIADDLGLDPDDPKVRSLVQQALSEAYEGES